MYKDWKESAAFTIYRQHDRLHRKSEKIYKKCSKINEMAGSRPIYSDHLYFVCQQET